jgi:hypothetical protein
MALTRKAVSRNILLVLVMSASLPMAVAAEPTHPTQIVTVLKVNNGQEC